MKTNNLARHLEASLYLISKSQYEEPYWCSIISRQRNGMRSFSALLSASSFGQDRAIVCKKMLHRLLRVSFYFMPYIATSKFNSGAMSASMCFLIHNQLWGTLNNCKSLRRMENLCFRKNNACNQLVLFQVFYSKDL